MVLTILATNLHDENSYGKATKAKKEDEKNSAVVFVINNLSF